MFTLCNPVIEYQHMLVDRQINKDKKESIGRTAFPNT